MRSAFFSVAVLATAVSAFPSNVVFERDSVDNTCGNTGAGTAGNSCSAVAGVNLCCSAAGYCGDSEGHCSVEQGCQAAFGTCTSADTSPPQYDTSTVPRTKVGNVGYSPYEIYNCVTPGTVAMTYDDGPWIYTAELLNILDEFGAKATFFITGDNLDKGSIADTANGWGAIIKDTYDRGHQLASHTWTHPDLSTLSADDIKAQFYRLESAFVGIVGKFPTYMRPPYSSCTAESQCQTVLSDLGYHITYYDLDTDDYDNDSPDLIQNAKDRVTAHFAGLNPAVDSVLSIQHDIHDQTVHNLTRFELETLTGAGFRAVTLGECLGDSADNWYRAFST